ncbi:thioesterase family protein [Maledivibacter halophilus]|uniref:Predicted thioesterase n=1 Tax=Maledivibacter halophilus TaxID=36842 RepID=A0A1T5LQU2_9FIRM|nr:hypothetical protein [Maledivibacter halophilus]SKC77888.1 Predicted thioesterase [Maledivibacter halophilus]
MLEVPNIKIGSNITIQRVVREQDTALNYGSGKLDKLFATPRLVALMIEASVKLVDSKLPEGFISVGKMTKVVHEQPTILGQTVSLKLEVKKFDGNNIIFEMIAYDEIGIIGKGTHERIIVNKKSLLRKANERAAKLENKDF